MYVGNVPVLVQQL